MGQQKGIAGRSSGDGGGRRARSWGWASLLVCLAIGGTTRCSSDGKGPHNLSELKIVGSVRTRYSGVTSDVQVVANCGDKTTTTVPKDDGTYELVADVKGCTPLVVGVQKESYLPVWRVIPLPPPTSSVTLDIEIFELSELVCGVEACVEEQDTFSTFPPGPMSRGWVVSMGGTTALPYLAGELLDSDDNLLWFTGFAYLDFRDQAGGTMVQFPAGQEFDECFEVTPEVLDWLVDLDPDTDTVEMNTYSFDSTTGRWRRRDFDAFISYMEYVGPDQFIYPATRAQLPDIRSDQFDGKRIFACTTLTGSGWVGLGQGIAHRTCFVIEAEAVCEVALPNVVVSMQGRDHGFAAATWTDDDGKACLPAVQSELIGQDYDSDGLGGETFFVDIIAERSFARQEFNSLENRREDGSCDRPSSCVRLDLVLDDGTYCAEQ